MPPRAGTRLRTKLRGKQTRRARAPGTGLPARKCRGGRLASLSQKSKSQVSHVRLPLEAGPGWGTLPPPGRPGRVPVGQPPQGLGTCVPGLADCSFCP